MTCVPNSQMTVLEDIGTVVVEEIKGGSITLNGHQLNVPFCTASSVDMFPEAYSGFGGMLGLGQPHLSSGLPFLIQQPGLNIPENIMTLDINNGNLMLGGLPPLVTPTT